MSSEESPLLDPPESADPITLEHDKVYSRFSPSQKRMIVAVVSWAALIPLFVSGSFVPSIPAVARELGSTGPVITYAVSLSIFSASITSLIWATYSGFYGRRPIYLASMPCLCIGSLGVASSRTVPSLMLWRVFQAFGTSSGISVGAGVIGDIYKLEERGTAIGLFFAASLLGAALAPLAGGIATHYGSWRDMQYVLLLAGLFALFLVVFYLPETSHPGARGVDKIVALDETTSGTFKWVWLNPFSGVALLRSPVLLAVTLTAACGLLTDYVLLLPLSYTIGVRYHITNEALIGAFFMASGIGNISLTAQFVDGRLGIVLTLLCLFMNGLGLDLVLSPINVYMVDVMHSRSAELVAAQKGVRNLLVAIATTGIFPLINLIGVAATNAIAAAISLVGFCLLWTTVRYGTQMRRWIDVGFSGPFDN